MTGSSNSCRADLDDVDGAGRDRAERQLAIARHPRRRSPAQLAALTVLGQYKRSFAVT